MDYFVVSSSPHVFSNQNTSKNMWRVSIALAPSAIYGVVVFGLYSLLVLFVSIATSLLTEFLLEKRNNRFTLLDGSAFLTGLLVGMNMSPIIPLYIPILASAFAIYIVKWVFGGLGCNWMNPALAGRAFVFFSFTSLMNKYKLPSTLNAVDALSSATPLTVIKTSTLGSFEALSAIDYPTSTFASYLSSKIGGSPYVYDAFFGNVGGCIGETSAFLLLLGFIYLVVTKVTKAHISIAYLASFAILQAAIIGLDTVIYSLFTGGLMLGALFMATDYVTTPITKKGKIIFGIGCGVLTFTLRNYGSLSEAVSLAIIFMNIWTLSIDRWIQPKLFGKVKKAKGGN